MPSLPKAMEFPAVSKVKLSYNRHIYLYAKKWYKHTDIIEDLRIIVSERCGQYRVGKDFCSKDCYVDLNDIVQVVLGCAYLYIVKENGNPEYHFTNFITNVSPENSWKVGYFNKQSNWASKEEKESLPEYNYQTAILHACMSVIGFVDVKTINKVEQAELGEPDYELFPMFVKELEEMERMAKRVADIKAHKKVKV